jgi:hypothetical protein
MTKVFSLFSTLFSDHPHDHRILHIAGKNKSGKSMLIKEYLAYDLARSDRSYFLIDTENKFALKNFKADLSIPHQERIFQTSLRPQERITKLFDILLTPDFPIQAGDVVIIDSLSEILKNSITKTEDWYEYRYELQQFSRTMMGKLIDLLVKKDLSCIFTHHVSYNPEYNQLIPYYFDLVNLIPGMWAYLEGTPSRMENGEIIYDNALILSISIRDTKNIRIIKVKNFRESFPYHLHEGHFTFISS